MKALLKKKDIQPSKIITYLVSSPCYYANGLDGVYYSIAICSESGTIIDIIGDHEILLGKYSAPKYDNINDIIGLDFSDLGRPISIKKVACDLCELFRIADAHSIYWNTKKEWDNELEKITGKCLYTYFYTGTETEIAEKEKKYYDWMEKNRSILPEYVDGYCFLKAII